jgi:large subunit ribosomal protein L24
MKIKAKDKVLVTAGKYKGKVGVVMRVYKKTNRITVEKINMRTKHIRKTPAQAGQKIRFEAPFDASKVMIICPNCNKAARVAYSNPKTGKKFRICAKCHESVEQAVSKIDKKKKA